MSGTGELRQLFEELLEASPEEREALLGSRSDGERRRLEAMLAAEESFNAAEPDEQTEAARPYPWPGDAIGSYRLLAPIGDGGMGTVWLAESRATPEVTVAIKFAAATRVDAHEARARLAQERRILARLDHPGVVPIVDAGEGKTQGSYLVMPLIDGQPINEHAKTLARGDRAALAGLIARLAEALDHVHERGFVHRDVKPSNVLVRPDGTVVLVDFGIARALDPDALTSAYVTQGVAPHTPAFASPEQESGTEVTIRTDVFALGKVAESLAASLGIEADGGFMGIVDRAVHADASQRQGSAGEFASQLDAWARPAAHRRGSPAPAMALGFLLGGIAAFVVFLVAEQRSPDTSTIEERADETPAVNAELLALSRALEEQPAAELSGEEEVFINLAERSDDPGWWVAAAHAALHEGHFDDAQEHAGRAFERRAQLSPLRQLDLAQLGVQLGLSGASVELLQLAAESDLDPERAWQAQALLLLQRVRAGEPLDEDDFDARSGLRIQAARELEIDDEELEAPSLEDLEELGPLTNHFLARLASGVPEAIEHWAEEVEPAAWRSPTEAPPALLEALLLLHARLLAADGVTPMDPEVLEELEEELWTQLAEEGDRSALRPWALARALRVGLLLESEPEEAERLADQGVAGLHTEGPAPADLEATLRILAARAVHGQGEEPDALESARTILQHARESCGEGVATRLERWLNRPFEVIAGRTTLAASRAATTAVEEQEEHRRRAPWWAR